MITIETARAECLTSLVLQPQNFLVSDPELFTDGYFFSFLKAALESEIARLPLAEVFLRFRRPTGLRSTITLPLGIDGSCLRLVYT